MKKKNCKLILQTLIALVHSRLDCTTQLQVAMIIIATHSRLIYVILGIVLGLVSFVSACQDDCVCPIVLYTDVAIVNQWCTCCNITLPPVMPLPPGDMPLVIEPVGTTGPFYINANSYTSGGTGTHMVANLTLVGDMALADGRLWTNAGECFGIHLSGGANESPIRVTGMRVDMHCSSSSVVTLTSSTFIIVESSIFTGGVGVVQPLRTAGAFLPFLRVEVNNFISHGAVWPVAVDLHGASPVGGATVVLTNSQHLVMPSDPLHGSVGWISFRLGGFDGTMSTVTENIGQAWSGIELVDTKWAWPPDTCFDGDTDFPYTRIRCVGYANRHTLRITTAAYECVDMCPVSPYNSDPQNPAQGQHLYANASQVLQITPVPHAYQYIFRVIVSAASVHSYIPIVYTSPDDTTCTSYPSTYGTLQACETSPLPIVTTAAHRRWSAVYLPPGSVHEARIHDTTWMFTRNFTVAELIACGSTYSSPTAVYSGLICTEMVVCATLVSYHSQCTRYTLRVDQTGSVIVNLNTADGALTRVDIAATFCMHGNPVVNFTTTTDHGYLLIGAYNMTLGAIVVQNTFASASGHCITGGTTHTGPCIQHWTLAWPGFVNNTHNGGYVPGVTAYTVFLWCNDDTFTLSPTHGNTYTSCPGTPVSQRNISIDITATLFCPDDLTVIHPREPGDGSALTDTDRAIGAGAVVGIVMGCFACMCCIGGGVWYRRRKQYLHGKQYIVVKM